MEENDVRLDYATDVYLIERVRKFELDKIEADHRARMAMFHGAYNVFKFALFGAAVIYLAFKIIS